MLSFKDSKHFSANELSQYRRIVLKIGSSLLVDPETGDMREPWFSTIIDDMAALHHSGTEWVIVSSGAVGLGRHGLGYEQGKPGFVEKQAAASVGQIRLVSGVCPARYSELAALAFPSG